MAIEVRFKIFKDPASATTHFLGALAAVVGVIFLVIHSLDRGPAKLTANAVYGATLIILFAASSAYHFFDWGERGNRLLKRMDHSAIFLLIAGSYLPPTIVLLEGNWRTGLITAVSIFAVAGVLFKVLWIDCPRYLSVGIYLVMGWLAIIAAPLILPQLDRWELVFLIGGGLAYTLGAVVYALKRPNPLSWFGHHEVWHLFVLAGALSHYGLNWQLLDRAYAPFF